MRQKVLASMTEHDSGNGCSRGATTRIADRVIERCEGGRTRGLPQGKTRMPGAGRLGDKARVEGPGDAHGCPACPHPAIGPAIVGSPTININRRPALRVDDAGIHAACCGPNTWTAIQGAPTVYFDGKAAFRMNDPGRSCGGMNKLIEGSSNVVIGNETSGGSGGAGASSGSGGSGGGGGGSGGGGGGSGGGGGGGTGGGSGNGGSGSGGGATGGPATGTSTSGGPATGTSTTGPSGPAGPDEHQIEVQVVNARGEPQRGVRYELTLPDGTVKSGTTSADGYIRVSGIPQSGNATLVLPDIDRAARS